MKITYIIVIVVIIVVVAAIIEITKHLKAYMNFICVKALEQIILNIYDNIDNGIDKYCDKSNVTHGGKRATIIASFN